MKPRHALLAAAAALAVRAAAGIQADLFLLDNTVYPDALCMDGSPGGYYFQPALNASASDKWVIHLQGGGECTTKELCDSRQGTPLASSKYFPPSQGLGFYNWVNHTTNPGFWEWNHVQLEYCSQDLHSGTVSTPSEGTWGYRFAGRHILAGVLGDLKAKHGLGGASEVILAGDSAGGMGVWVNLRFVADALPGALVGGAPIAGFYFYVDPYTGPGATKSYLADFQAAAWPGHVALWGSQVDAACAAAHADNPSFCMLGNNSHPYMPAPVMVVESLTDKVVLLYHDSVPDQDTWTAPVLDYFTHWQANMTQGLVAAVDQSPHPVGVFSPSCFIHTEFQFNSPLLSGVSYLQAAAKWWDVVKAGSASAAPPFLMDSCGVLCNPTCPHHGK